MPSESVTMTSGSIRSIVVSGISSVVNRTSICCVVLSVISYGNSSSVVIGVDSVSVVYSSTICCSVVETISIRTEVSSTSWVVRGLSVVVTNCSYSVVVADTSTSVVSKSNASVVSSTISSTVVSPICGSVVGIGDSVVATHSERSSGSELSSTGVVVGVSVVPSTRFQSSRLFA